MADDKTRGEQVVISNRKARYDYFIEENYEAGIALQGTEVKSLRQGRANLQDAHASVVGGELMLYALHISPYDHGNLNNHEPTRTRKLLMHRIEIDRLFKKIEQKGYTLVPLKIYFKGGRAKVELGLGKGKKNYDKRQDSADRDADRDLRRVMKDRSRADD